MRLVLASASPRRRALLRAAGFAFEVVDAAIDERARPAEQPGAYVRRLAIEKSAAVERTRDRAGAVIVGADTVVVVGGRMLGKPGDAREAESMLRLLSGRRHHVLTGLSVRSAGGETGTVESSAVDFAPMADSDLDWYLSSGEWMDKAGAYAIQGAARRFVLGIEGSYSNIVGLPLGALCTLLRSVAAASLASHR